MLDREGGDSPSPEDEADGGLSIDEVWMAVSHKQITVYCRQEWDNRLARKPFKSVVSTEMILGDTENKKK